MSKVLVFGTFDHLHEGHRYLLDNAEKLGQLYIVIARDRTVKHVKKHAPDYCEADRLAVVAAAYPNAIVQLGDEEDYLVPVRSIKPDCIVLGYDQKLPSSLSLEDLGCKAIRMDAFHPEKYKSSIVRKNK